MKFFSLSRLLFWIAVFIFQGINSRPLFGQADQNQRQSQGKPWLGIAIEKGKAGVLVKGVIPGTPAEQAGIQTGDEVLRIDTTSVSEPTQLISAVQNSGIGQQVVVVLQRGKVKITKKLKLEARPDELKLIRDKLVGKPAPVFNLKSIHGTEKSSSEALKGRVIIVEFWATWCPACRASHPRLSEFAKQHPEIAVVAISDEDAPTLKEYANKVQPKFTILQDTSHQQAEAWNASVIPMLGVINKKGIVAFVTIGAGVNLEEALTEAISLSK